jgi:hypothetical protein
VPPQMKWREACAPGSANHALSLVCSRQRPPQFPLRPYTLGEVTLILLCRTALPGAPDARALIALARQVSITLENAALREVAKRTASGRPD